MTMRKHRIVVAALLLPAAIILTPSPSQAAALGQREVLPNGMVLLTAERRAVPIVTMSMWIQAGSMVDPPDKPGVANLVAQVMTQGTKTRTAPQISEAIEFMGGSLSVEAGHELATMSLSVLSKDLDAGLDLLTDVLLNPVFNPEDIQRKIREVVAGIKRDQEDPGTVSCGVKGPQWFGGTGQGVRDRLIQPCFLDRQLGRRDVGGLSYFCQISGPGNFQDNGPPAG